MKNRFNIFYLVLSLLGLWSCGEKPAEVAGTGSGWETPVASVMGLGTYENGTAAKFAHVSLRKTEYLSLPVEGAALSKRSSESFDVLTDSTGRFALDSLELGTYYLEINDNNGMAQLSLITLFKDTVLDTKILKRACTLVGVVDELASESPKESYVQIYGLERFAIVNPVTGIFQFKNLPSGTFALRAFARSKTIGAREINTPRLNPGDSLQLPPITLDNSSKEDYANWAHVGTVSWNTSSKGSKISGTLFNFPLLIRFNKSIGFDFSEAHPKGHDLRFSKEDGTHLPYEIEYWNADSSEGAVWVLVDSVLAQTSYQSIKVYWGKLNASDYSSPNAVFDTSMGFSGVWHLSEEGNRNDYGYRDATPNAAHGKGVQMTTASDVSSVIGKGQRFDGIQNFLAIPKEELFDFSTQMTVSVWTKIEKLDKYFQALVTKGDNTWRLHQLNTTQGVRFASTFNGTIRSTDETRPLDDHEWHLITATYNGAKLSLYIDGLLTMSSVTTGPIDNTIDPVWIGNNAGAANRYWNGIIDEVRLSKIARTSDWILLSYLTQNPHSNFLNFTW